MINVNNKKLKLEIDISLCDTMRVAPLFRYSKNVTCHTIDVRINLISYLDIYLLFLMDSYEMYFLMTQLDTCVVFRFAIFVYVIKANIRMLFAFIFDR